MTDSNELFDLEEFRAIGTDAVIKISMADTLMTRMVLDLGYPVPLYDDLYRKAADQIHEAKHKALDWDDWFVKAQRASDSESIEATVTQARLAVASIALIAQVDALGDTMTKLSGNLN